MPSTDNPTYKPLFKVVGNAENQFATWQADRTNAVGWSDANFVGSQAECIKYIENISTVRQRKPNND